MILDNYPFLDYLPIGALDGATEVGPSFTGLRSPSELWVAQGQLLPTAPTPERSINISQDAGVRPYSRSRF